MLEFARQRRNFLGGLAGLWAGAAAAQTSTLKVASFNILHGGQGDGGPLAQTAQVITASGAIYCVDSMTDRQARIAGRR